MRKQLSFVVITLIVSSRILLIIVVEFVGNRQEGCTPASHDRWASRQFPQKRGGHQMPHKADVI